MYLKLLVPNTLGRRKTWLLQHLGDGSWRGTWSFLILNGCLVSEVEIRESKTRCKQDVPLFATKYKTSLIVDYKGTPLNSTELLMVETFHYVFIRLLGQQKEPYLFSILLIAE